MPLYEYQCKNPEEACEHCAKPFEVFQNIKENPLEICPRCACEIEKVVSNFSFNSRITKKELLSDKNIKEKGFTKLVNEGNGKWTKAI